MVLLPTHSWMDGWVGEGEQGRRKLFIGLSSCDLDNARRAGGTLVEGGERSYQQHIKRGHGELLSLKRKEGEGNYAPSSSSLVTNPQSASRVNYLASWGSACLLRLILLQDNCFTLLITPRSISTLPLLPIPIPGFCGVSQ